MPADISALIKSKNKTRWLTVSGLIVLWTGFYCLTHDFFHDGAARISFGFGIPFLITSGLLTFALLTNKQVALRDTKLQQLTISFIPLRRTLTRLSKPVILSASVPANIFQLDFSIMTFALFYVSALRRLITFPVFLTGDC